MGETGYTWGSLFDAAAAANSDPEFTQGRGAQTVTSNAIDSMQPITSGGDSWGDFWRGAISSGLNYAMTRDALRQRNDGAGQAPAATAPAAGVPMGTVVLIGGGLLVVGVLVFALRKG